MCLIPEHTRILAVLRFIGEQLLCAIKEDEPVGIDVGGGFGALESDEAWVHTDAAHPPFAKMVPL